MNEAQWFLTILGLLFGAATVTAIYLMNQEPETRDHIIDGDTE